MKGCEKKGVEQKRERGRNRGVQQKWRGTDVHVGNKGGEGGSDRETKKGEEDGWKGGRGKKTNERTERGR